jgi:tRNA A37 threonylcarbamoyladenosine dehydratase
MDLAAKFKDEVVAIIGLGGTGAYLLDFLVKTLVREIRAYDDYHLVFDVTDLKTGGKTKLDENQ